MKKFLKVLLWIFVAFYYISSILFNSLNDIISINIPIWLEWIFIYPYGLICFSVLLCGIYFIIRKINPHDKLSLQTSLVVLIIVYSIYILLYKIK